MGTYVNTFRTENKTAILPGGRPVKVYASRYLCNLRDTDDHWGERKRRASLMQASMDRSASLFAEHRPAYIAGVYENRWEGANVYAEPKGAIWYDCDAFPGRLVGFLSLPAGKRGYTIVTERRGESQVTIAGNRFTRRYVERVADGKLTQTVLAYVDAKGQTFTPEQIDAWRGPAEAQWVAACQAQEDARREVERVAHEERIARQAAKDAEIAQVVAQLEALRRERVAI